MNEMLHAEMKAGTLRLAGNHRGAEAVEAAARERGRVLALAADPLGDALTAVRQTQILTPDQAESLRVLRDEVVRAIHLAWEEGLDRGPAGKSRVEKNLREEFRRWAELARLPADIVEKQVAEILAITYPDPDKPATGTAEPTKPQPGKTISPIVGPVASLSLSKSYLPNPRLFPHGIRLVLR